MQLAAVSLGKPAAPFIAQSFTVSQTIHFSSCCLTSYRMGIPDSPHRFPASTRPGWRDGLARAAIAYIILCRGLAQCERLLIKTEAQRHPVKRAAGLVFER